MLINKGIECASRKILPGVIVGRVFAIAGKGGVGKTTISSMIVSYLSKKTGKMILAVDADPNYNLGEKFGICIERTIGDLREELQKASDEASEISKREKAEYNLKLTLEEGNGFDLITMGRSEGKGCYCYINSILRDYLDDAIDQYPYIVMDNEAGMEHISRLTCKRMDVLIIVADATSTGLKTAKRILDLAQSLGIEISMSVLIINRVLTEIDADMIPNGFSKTYCIPYDEKIEILNAEGSPLELNKDNPAYTALMEIIDDILIKIKNKKL